MPPKRQYNNSRRKVARKYKVTPKKANVSAATIQSAVRRAISRNIETKSACTSVTDYQQIGHNSFIGLYSGDLLATTQGITDPKDTNLACRLGDQINLSSIHIRMMLELNERYSDVTYRILVIKSAKADSIIPGNLFCGLSGNRMLDRIDKERFTVLFEKWGKITAPNPGALTTLAGVGTTVGGGLFDGDTDLSFSRKTQIVKFILPGKLFSKTGVIQYENGSSQVKMNDYSLLIYAYSNFTTSSALGFNVLAVNDLVKEMYFKDA